MPSENLSASIALYQNSRDDVLTVSNSLLGSPSDELKDIANIDNRIYYKHNPCNSGYVAHNRQCKRALSEITSVIWF